jgi:glycosyltransferase involved in cell wall biosynthesis
MNLNTLSIIIIAGKEEDIIINCVKSAIFANEIVMVATPACTPKTIKLAKSVYPKIIVRHYSDSTIDFSAWHNIGSQIATSTWLLHLDCDERISPELKEEILSKINIPNNPITNYDIPRANYFLGKRVHHGGTYPDYVKRLYRKASFHSYQGIIHEQPQIDGQSGIIKSDLIHFTHRSLATMLAKSITWTDTEAEALYLHNHPPVVWWRFIRMMFTKVWQRLIVEQMWRDGTVGWISVIFETFDTFMIYARLWELQQNQAQ